MPVSARTGWGPGRGRGGGEAVPVRVVLVDGPVHVALVVGQFCGRTTVRAAGPRPFAPTEPTERTHLPVRKSVMPSLGLSWGALRLLMAGTGTERPRELRAAIVGGAAGSGVTARPVPVRERGRGCRGHLKLF